MTSQDFLSSVFKRHISLSEGDTTNKFLEQLWAPLSLLLWQIWSWRTQNNVPWPPSNSPSPLFWKIYVDDTCVAMLPSMVESFHKHLNSIEPSIQFTVKTENSGQLAFLDINISRHSDGSLSTCVYRKKTHNDQYLQFSSHHPSFECCLSPQYTIT